MPLLQLLPLHLFLRGHETPKTPCTSAPPPCRHAHCANVMTALFLNTILSQRVKSCQMRVQTQDQNKQIEHTTVCKSVGRTTGLNHSNRHENADLFFKVLSQTRQLHRKSLTAAEHPCLVGSTNPRPDAMTKLVTECAVRVICGHHTSTLASCAAEVRERYSHVTEMISESRLEATA